jgi:muramoyltetrapeptide carboxypeptidase LdcA involved in peptidoglycan recycling
MELIKNPQVKCLMSVIGGYNSASMIPYLDFSEIRNSRKLICGYSDATSLLLAILRYSRLSTFYGPALVPTFGEYPSIMRDSLDSFLALAQGTPSLKRTLTIPQSWSRQFIDASQPGWKEIERTYLPNPGWIALSPGSATAPLVVGNLETLLTSAGTPYFPTLKGTILAIEETLATFSRTECNFSHLKRMGVFDELAGLIISKPGDIDPEGAPFSHEELIREIIGLTTYPIIYNFDCGHTFPMITLSQGITVSINASKSGFSEITLEESAVE